MTQQHSHPEFQVEGTSRINTESGHADSSDLLGGTNTCPKKAPFSSFGDKKQTAARLFHGRPIVKKPLPTPPSLKKLCVVPHKNSHSSRRDQCLDDNGRHETKTPTPEELKLLEEMVKKLPDKAVFNILCNHFSSVGTHTKDEFFRRAIKWRRGTAAQKINNHCIMCYIQSMAANPLQTDYENIMSSVNYPPHFYNQFSREEKQISPRASKVLFQICKKADLRKKAHFMSIPPPAPPGSVEDINTTLSRVHLNETPDSEYSASRVERLMQIYSTPKRDIHSKCQPKPPTFHLSSSGNADKMKPFYKRKALKGCFPKRENPDKEKLLEEIKQESHPVDTLGLNFVIPKFKKHLCNGDRSTSKSPPRIKKRLILPPIKPSGTEKVIVA